MVVRSFTQKIKIFGTGNQKLIKFNEFFTIKKQDRFDCSVKTHPTNMTANFVIKGLTFVSLDQIF